jgi:hypothetical protein
MKGYCWQCQNPKCAAHSDRPTFADGVQRASITTFIWDDLFPADWDQSKLVQRCKRCKGDSVRIAYEYERKKDPEKLTLIHAVGICEGDWRRMMWESIAEGKEDERWFSSNYMYGRNPTGLSRATALSQKALRDIT